MKNKNIYLRYIPMSLAAAFLLFFAVKNALYPPKGEEIELWYLIFKTLPTIVTLFVQLLMMSANRYAFLLGGCNSVIYGIVYFMEDVPFSGISALMLSFCRRSIPLSIGERIPDPARSRFADSPRNILRSQSQCLQAFGRSALFGCRNI